MPRGRQLPPVVLTDEQREQVTALSESTSMPYGLVQRARIVLACAQGLTNSAVAKRLAVSPSAVGKWRRRFIERGVQGLHDELRPGRPRTYDDEKVAVLINRALQHRKARPRRRLERAPDGRSRGRVEEHRATVDFPVRGQAAPQRHLQAGGELTGVRSSRKCCDRDRPLPSRSRAGQRRREFSVLPNLMISQLLRHSNAHEAHGARNPGSGLCRRCRYTPGGHPHHVEPSDVVHRRLYVACTGKVIGKCSKPALVPVRSCLCLAAAGVP